MSKSKMRNGMIAALDVGTSKVCCFIAHVEDGGALRIAGIGFHEARGLRAGAVVDMEAAEESILAAVHHAEQMADETIREVTLSLSSGRRNPAPSPWRSPSTAMKSTIPICAGRSSRAVPPATPATARSSIPYP